MRDTMVMVFDSTLRAGPDVSLKGSPRVSPTTVELWRSLYSLSRLSLSASRAAGLVRAGVVTASLGSLYMAS